MGLRCGRRQWPKDWKSIPTIDFDKGRENEERGTSNESDLTAITIALTQFIVV